MDIIQLSITRIAKTSVCAAVEDGERVYEAIIREFSLGNSVNLSFKGVKFVISAFLNPAIGKLYGHYEDNYIKERLSVSDVTLEHIYIIKEVTDNAKKYFKLKDTFDKFIGESDKENNEEEN
ncbi:hypothetical protein DESA109040_21840 [Deinococcus saxicola]|uniref:STAS-like domain-containing protein n=1 Tax=Deinococcus saxicola TaxID=249406 RepID=UPI0039EEB203